MLMNGDSTIHTSRLWSVSASIICTNLQGFIYFLTNVKMCSKLNTLSGCLSLMFSLLEVGWGGGDSSYLRYSFHPLPYPLLHLVVSSEIYILLLAVDMNSGYNFKPWKSVSASADVAVGTDYAHNIRYHILEIWVQQYQNIKVN